MIGSVLRRLIDEALHLAYSGKLQSGQVLEVHVQADWPVDWPETVDKWGWTTTVTEFVRDWSHVAHFGTPEHDGVYLGLVHEAGALLVRLDNTADDDDGLLPGYNGRTADEVAEIANSVVAELPEAMRS